MSAFVNMEHTVDVTPVVNDIASTNNTTSGNYGGTTDASTTKKQQQQQQPGGSRRTGITKQPAKTKAMAPDILQAAATRWLNVSEILYLLSSDQTLLQKRSTPPESPPVSGTLLLYDRNVTRNYKSDGHSWIKKRNSAKVREDHVKLRVRGINKVAGCYVHGAEISTLHRRAYHFIHTNDESAEGGGEGGGNPSGLPIMPYQGHGPKNREEPNLVVVHYLDTECAARVSAEFAAQMTLTAATEMPSAAPVKEKIRRPRKTKDAAAASKVEDAPLPSLPPPPPSMSTSSYQQDSSTNVVGGSDAFISGTMQGREHVIGQADQQQYYHAHQRQQQQQQSTSIREPQQPSHTYRDERQWPQTYKNDTPPQYEGYHSHHHQQQREHVYHDQQHGQHRYQQGYHQQDRSQVYHNEQPQPYLQHLKHPPQQPSEVYTQLSGQPSNCGYQYQQQQGYGKQQYARGYHDQHSLSYQEQQQRDQQHREQQCEEERLREEQRQEQKRQEQKRQEQLVQQRLEQDRKEQHRLEQQRQEKQHQQEQENTSYRNGSPRHRTMHTFDEPSSALYEDMEGLMMDDDTDRSSHTHHSGLTPPVSNSANDFDFTNTWSPIFRPPENSTSPNHPSSPKKESASGGILQSPVRSQGQMTQNDHGGKTLHGHHHEASLSILDVDALDDLWSQIMDDEGNQLDDELMLAASHAIDEHLNEEVTHGLVQSMEHAILQQAQVQAYNNASSTDAVPLSGQTEQQKISSQQGTTTLSPTPYALKRIPSSSKVMNATSNTMYEDQLVSTLDHHLPQALELKLAQTIENELRGKQLLLPQKHVTGTGSNDVQSKTTPCPQQLQTGKDATASPVRSGAQGGSATASRGRGKQLVLHGGTLRPTSSEDSPPSSGLEEHEAREKHQEDDVTPISTTDVKHDIKMMEVTVVGPGGDDASTVSDCTNNTASLSASKMLPSPEDQDRKDNGAALIQQVKSISVPLPEIVDFTPEQILVDGGGSSSTTSKRPCKLVCSLSSPLLDLPTETAGFRWSSYVAFVTLNPGHTISKSSGAAMNNVKDVFVGGVALSPLKELNPFSYKAQVPASDDVTSGIKFLMLVSVKIPVTSGKSAMISADYHSCQKFADAVKISIQAAWNKELGNVGNGTLGETGMARPYLFSHRHDATGATDEEASTLNSDTVLLRTQISLETFEFIGGSNSSRTSSVRGVDGVSSIASATSSVETPASPVTSSATKMRVTSDLPPPTPTRSAPPLPPTPPIQTSPSKTHGHKPSFSMAASKDFTDSFMATVADAITNPLFNNSKDSTEQEGTTTTTTNDNNKPKVYDSPRHPSDNKAFTNRTELASPNTGSPTRTRTHSASYSMVASRDFTDAFMTTVAEAITNPLYNSSNDITSGKDEGIDSPRKPRVYDSPPHPSDKKTFEIEKPTSSTASARSASDSASATSSSLLPSRRRDNVKRRASDDNEGTGVEDWSTGPTRSIKATTRHYDVSSSSTSTNAPPLPSVQDDKELIERHCKVRLMERLFKINKATDEITTGSSMDNIMDDTQQQQQQTLKETAIANLFGGIGNREETLSSSTLMDTGDADGASEDVEEPPMKLLSDEELFTMDNDSLDEMLDGLLVKFVETLMDTDMTNGSTSNSSDNGAGNASDEYEDSDDHAANYLSGEINKTGFSGFTLLHYAALYNLLPLVPLLISRGANPNTTSEKGGLTPLHMACGAGNMAIVQALVNNGSDLRALDSQGFSPLQHALRNGFPVIGQYLMVKLSSLDGSSNTTTTTTKDSDDKNSNNQVEAAAAAAADSSASINSSEQQNTSVAAASSVKDGNYNDDDDDKEKIVKAAFSNLALQDKLGVNYFMKRHQSSGSVPGTPSSSGDRKIISNINGEDIDTIRQKDDATKTSNHGQERNDAVDDSASTTTSVTGEKQQQGAGGGGKKNRFDNLYSKGQVITEQEKQNLDSAMTLMCEGEEFNYDQHMDARSYMLRRNYAAMREALQTTQEERKKIKQQQRTAAAAAAADAAVRKKKQLELQLLQQQQLACSMGVLGCQRTLSSSQMSAIEEGSSTCSTSVKHSDDDGPMSMDVDVQQDQDNNQQQSEQQQPQQMVPSFHLGGGGGEFKSNSSVASCNSSTSQHRNAAAHKKNRAEALARRHHGGKPQAMQQRRRNSSSTNNAKQTKPPIAAGGAAATSTSTRRSINPSSASKNKLSQALAMLVLRKNMIDMLPTTTTTASGQSNTGPGGTQVTTMPNASTMNSVSSS